MKWKGILGEIPEAGNLVKIKVLEEQLGIDSKYSQRRREWLKFVGSLD